VYILYMEISKRSNGGKQNGKILRQKALDNYLNNPNHCLSCNEIITPQIGRKITETKRKKFCNRSCAASYNNIKYKKRKPIAKPIKEKIDISNLTKGQVFEKYKTWQSARSRIRLNACLILGNKKPCFNCGYHKHVEVCHIKAVSSYEDSSLISEINSKENLLFLCPNCHWEFDTGVLEIGCGSENRTQVASL